MLSNLRAELVRKNLIPEKAIEAAIGCTNKTARAKLNGESDFTLTEAMTVMSCFFAEDNFKYEFLFASCNSQVKS